MSELKNGANQSSEFKEAVCIDGGRVYDSCCEQHQTIYISSLILNLFYYKSF